MNTTSPFVVCAVRVIPADMTKRVKIPLDYCDNGPKFPGDAEITNVELIGDQYSISNLNTCPGDLGVQDFSKWIRQTFHWELLIRSI